MKRKIFNTLGISFAMAISLAVTALAAEGETDVFLDSLSGSYEELFPVMDLEENKQIWYDNFNAVLGVEDEETAEMLRQMIISMFSTGVHGKDAVELAAEDSTYQLFDCNYAEEVNELTIDGNVISGTDKDGNEIFSHQYTLIDSIKCDFGAMNEVYEAYFTDETWPMMAIYESDGEEDAFKYFAFAGDSPEETYHIEFRYGSELDNLTAYYDGDYAYWMASGFLKDAPDGMIEDCIALFVAENADSFQGMIE